MSPNVIPAGETTRITAGETASGIVEVVGKPRDTSKQGDSAHYNIPKPARTFRVDPGRFRGSLSETLQELFALLSWSEERDGDETKPNPASVAHAVWWVLQIHKVAARGGSGLDLSVATTKVADLVS